MHFVRVFLSSCLVAAVTCWHVMKATPDWLYEIAFQALKLSLMMPHQPPFELAVEKIGMNSSAEQLKWASAASKRFLRFLVPSAQLRYKTLAHTDKRFPKHSSRSKPTT